MNEKILIVDDDHNLLRVISYQLSEAGYEVMTASSAARGLKMLESEAVDLLLTDVKMPDMDGMELFARAHELKPELPVIFITAYAAIDSAVEAIKNGATDYIPKPFAREDLLNKVSRALEAGRLKDENVRLKQALARKEGFDELVGSSDAIRKIFDLVTHVAPSDSTVLIQGESGTGKELIARAVHRLSRRSAGPFVAINCTAIPKDLLESELFGHIRGAFTGAIRDRVGVFQQAHGGTLFLDEVGDIALDLQPKLLRVLQEREVVRVGATKPERVDVRVVTATHSDLSALTQVGRFREDLFYRLHVIPITVPPLRERTGDVPLLAAHLLKKHFPDRAITITPDALAALESYPWPGNVRELENLIERTGVLSPDDNIGLEDLPVEIRGHKNYRTVVSWPDSISPAPQSLWDAEKKLIIEAIEASHGNQSEAARRLGIPRHVLLYRLKKFGVARKIASKLDQKAPKPQRNPTESKFLAEQVRARIMEIIRKGKL